MKILVNFKVQTYDLGSCGDDEPIEYNISEYFDGDTKFNELVDGLVKKYIIPTKENLGFPYYYILNLYKELWGEYIDMDSGFYYDGNADINPRSLKLELWKLNDQFDLSNKVFELSICGPGIGGEVGNFHGIKFYFHMNEKDIHHKPHIHCSSSGEEIRVDLNDIAIMDKPFKNKAKTKKALELISLNKNGLIKYWNEVIIGGKCEYMKFKMKTLNEEYIDE